MKINIENWTSSHYYQGNLRAFVSIGGDFIESREEKSATVHYLVTTTDKDYVEIFQTKHETLEEALSNINRKFSQWEWRDADLSKSGDGCTSCAAH